MQQLENQIKQWADGKWPNRTLASRLRKLGEEFGELAEAVASREGYRHYGKDASSLCAVKEAADCAIILSDICSMLGYSLSGVMTEKFAEVQARPVVHSSTEAFYGRKVQPSHGPYGCFRNAARDASDWCDSKPFATCCEHANADGTCQKEGSR